MITILSFRDLVRVFFIFRREFKWAFLATVTVALVGAFVLPPRYESEARLLVKPGRANATLPLELSDRQAIAVAGLQRDLTADEEKVLTGRPIIRKVAEQYLDEMSKAPPPKTAWKAFKRYVGTLFSDALDALRALLEAVGLVEAQTPVDRLASKLEKNFRVTHSTGSAVMEVAFTWDDPLLAQRVVDSWIRFYQDERIRPLGSNNVYRFYDEQSKKAALAIDDYKSRLRTLHDGVDAVDVQQRIDHLTKRLDTLQAQAFDANAELHALQRGATSAAGQAATLPAEITSEREVSLNPTQLDLKNRLNELQLKRANDLRVYLPESAPIKALDESIAQIKQQIAAEPATLQRLQNHAPNALVTSLKQSLQQKRIRISELTALVAQLQQHILEVSGALRKAVAAEPEISRLQRALAALEKNQALYAESLEKSRIDGALDRERISNIAVIEEPTFNPARVFPKSVTLLLAALPAGLVVGLFVVYLCYLLELRIHDGGRVEQVFGVPLWATLADCGAPAGPLALAINLHHTCSLLPLSELAQRGLTLALGSARPGEGVSFVAEQWRRALVARGHDVRVGGDAAPAPNQIVLLDCSALLTDHAAFQRVQRADLIVLVVEAKKTSIPTVRHLIALLRASFGKVDGLVVNRRQFEIPERVLQWCARWQGA
jgi:uncharacterized protein involved in exopolysaccharide biosynthesis